MNARASSSRLSVEGPAGPLEALLEQPAPDCLRRIAVVCHPHPLQQGTMQNKVVHTLCRALQSLGAATLRFNFRGVGQSAGEWDRGTGETLDVLAACRFMRQRFPGLPLALAGFSFGAAMALRAAETADADWLVTVAPPPRLLDVRAMPHPPSSRWLLVQGRDDDIVPHAEQRAWLSERGLAPALAEPDGVGHFFHGQLTRLRDIVIDHFSSEVQDA